MKRATVQLGDFLTLKRGYDLPEHARLPGDIPVVSSSGVTGTHKEAKVDGPGVVTGRYGTLGEVFYIEKPFWPLNTALYVQDFKGNHRRFVSYFLKWVLNGTQSDKAAVPGVNRNDLHARKVEVSEDPREQAFIASVLSAYDDLIENNFRRIELLERSARLLYEEWFVRLRFPGHERVRIKDGIPARWVSVPLSELCFDVRSPVSPWDVPENTPYIGLEHIPKRSITLLNWGHASDVDSNKFEFLTGDILFGKIRPYFHKVGFALVNGITSSDAIVIRARNEALYFYCLFLVSSHWFVNLASKTVREGSKMPRADWGYLLNCPFLLPELVVLNRFNVIASGIVAQLRTLALQNQKLKQARDLLLPRLMNGEITV